MHFQFVFASPAVGTDGDGVACHIHLGGVLVEALGVLRTERHNVTVGLHGLVLRLADEP